MKRPNITPGPWNLQPLPENTWNVSAFILAKGETKETATAMVKGEANAQAIAALPDLMDALEALYKGAAESSGFHQATTAIKARAALTKAGYTF